MDEKQQYGGYGAGGPPYPSAAGGVQGYAPTGGFPQTGFAGPGYPVGGYGAGVPVQQPGFSQQHGFMSPPAMGFHMPTNAGYTDERPKPGPYSNESGNAYGGDDLQGMDFSEKAIRMAFIRKVYGILGMQLLLTTGIIALFCFHEGVKGWVRTNPAFYISSYIVAIVLLLAIACCESARRKSPQNLILLGLFTLTYGVVIGVISSMYNAQSVVVAAGITVVICLSLTAFSFQTKYDFTVMGGALFCCLIVFTLFGFIAIFVRLPMFQLILAAFGALLFSVYLVYDTQLMMGGKHKLSISPEEYVFASLNLYMDVVMIFLYILQLFGSRD